jgi:hypothetical protein
VKNDIPILKFLCVLCVLCGASLCARAEDTVILKDGKTVKGEVSHQDADNVYVKLADGEARAIPKANIVKIERRKTIAGGAPAPGTKAPDIPAAPETSQKIPAPNEKEVSALFNALKELGSSDPAKRATALELAKQKKEEAVPVLLGMLNPKLNGDEWTHVGILRALGDLAPLSDQAAQTLAWCAVSDPHPEARREACNTIRRTSDDRAIRQLTVFGTSENPKQRQAGAVALHEIDDNRVLAALIRAVPMPSVTANLGEQPNQLQRPDYNLPVGPRGASIPIFLPKGEIAGTATDISSPAADLLRAISGKDLGNLPYGWVNWYREKMGETTEADRESYREKSSVRQRMNAP